MAGIALVGAGRWGQNLARNLARERAWDLRWVCDTDIGRAGQLARASGARSCGELERVLDDRRVSTVVIATPTITHAAIATACLAADLHVLVEKPLADSFADAEALADTARAHDRVLLCDHTYRFTSAAEKLRTLIDRGELGDLVGMVSTRTNFCVGQPDVDVFWDLAFHDLSLADLFFDGAEPTDVLVDVHTVADDGRATAGALHIVLASGARVRVDVGWKAVSKRRVLELHGTRRTLRWDDLSAQPLSWSGSSGEAGPVLSRSVEPLQLVVRELLDVVRGTRAPRCAIDVDLRVLATLERARLSSLGRS